MNQYVIRGGAGGYERLALLARTRWPDTAALLARAGLSPGMRCIDIGCGGGHVTVETDGEGKTLPWSTLEASADAIIAERVASADEVAAALATLWRFTGEAHTLISGPRVFQIWSRR